MEIGKKLFISEVTVKIHLHNIYQKLGAAQSSPATLRKRDSCRRAGWLEYRSIHHSNTPLLHHSNSPCLPDLPYLLMTHVKWSPVRV
jgi:hypothetical protein